MSRAHVQGYDSNAAQFERMGNPWVSERERQEFSAPSRKEARQNRNPKRGADLGNFPKPVLDRSVDPRKRRRDFVALALSRIGGSRTVTPVIAKPDDAVVKAPALTELKPLTSEQLALRRAQRDQVSARLEAGEAAYAASEAARLAEIRRLEAARDAIEERLASLANFLK
jgi:hypothetical protein